VGIFRFEGGLDKERAWTSGVRHMAALYRAVKSGSRKGLFWKCNLWLIVTSI